MLYLLKYIKLISYKDRNSEFYNNIKCNNGIYKKVSYDDY